MWEAQFIEILGSESTKNILLGNIYRPPRNSNENWTVFIDNFKEILDYFATLNHEIMLVGDFNINLLKLHEKPMFNDFFESMVSHSFFPKITLPTRFSDKNGTFIDNIFCKISETTLKTMSGIFTRKLSDHQPYFTCLDIKTSKNANPKYVKTYINNSDAVNKTIFHLQNENLKEKIDSNHDGNPNTNYKILSEAVENALSKNIPCKTVKFNRYKHKKNP